MLLLELPPRNVNIHHADFDIPHPRRTGWECHQLVSRYIHTTNFQKLYMMRRRCPRPHSSQAYQPVARTPPPRTSSSRYKHSSIPSKSISRFTRKGKENTSIRSGYVPKAVSVAPNRLALRQYALLSELRVLSGDMTASRRFRHSVIAAGRAR